MRVESFSVARQFEEPCVRRTAEIESRTGERSGSMLLKSTQRDGGLKRTRRGCREDG